MLIYIYILIVMQQFLIQSNNEYQNWRFQKLKNYPMKVEQLIVEISNPFEITLEEKKAIQRNCLKTNFSIYRLKYDQSEDKSVVIAIARQLGLSNMDANLCADEDCVSTIKVSNEDQMGSYIPYTDKLLNWHTDGYYNKDERRIRAFLMHCVCPAKIGGENSYFDPEIAYILLRDKNPKYVEALMQNGVMTIPSNCYENQEIRQEKTGPVFILDKETQSLYMRYTARSRNIIWKDDPSIQQAKNALTKILSNNQFKFNYKLKNGEGVICNNVIHNRQRFIDDPERRRLLFRARFYNRVAKPDQNLGFII